MNLSSRQKGILSLVLLSVVFGSMGIYSRYLNTGFHLFQQVYLRMSAGLVFGILLFKKDLHLSKLSHLPRRDWGLLFFRAFTNYVVGITLLTQAYLLTTISNVLFVGAIPLTAIFGVILLKERITSTKVALVVVSTLGVILIAVKDYSRVLVFGKGELVTLLSAAGFSLSYIARKWHTDKLTDKELTVVMLTIATIILFILSLLTGEGLPIGRWTSGLFEVILFAGFLNTIILYLINYGFKHVEAILANSLVTLEVVFGPIFGFFLYREIPTLKELIGGALIMISVFAMNQLEQAKKTGNLKAKL